MIFEEFPKSREKLLRECRIGNITNALFMADSGREVFEALLNIPHNHIAALHDMCAAILQGKDEL